MCHRQFGRARGCRLGRAVPISYVLCPCPAPVDTLSPVHTLCPLYISFPRSIHYGLSPVHVTCPYPLSTVHILAPRPTPTTIHTLYPVHTLCALSIPSVPVCPVSIFSTPSTPSVPCPLSIPWQLDCPTHSSKNRPCHLNSRHLQREGSSSLQQVSLAGAVSITGMGGLEAGNPSLRGYPCRVLEAWVR